MSARRLFIQRDGALLARTTAPSATLRWIEEAIPALWLLRRSGFELVLIDSPALALPPQAARDTTEIRRTEQALELCRSQGLDFIAVLGCAHGLAEACNCPREALRLNDLVGNPYDRSGSALLSAAHGTLPLADVLGVREIVVDPASPDATWPRVARDLIQAPRTAHVTRTTKETAIEIDLNLDVPRDAEISTGIGFFDHMLEQIGKHASVGLTIRCRGDRHVDEHHTVEDVALAFGEALRRALGDKRGIQRYGFVLPMDEANAEIALDLGGRPYLVFEGSFPRTTVGKLPTELVPHFFRSLADTFGAAIQIRVRGENAHHMVEACFKGFARALRQAVARDGHELPTTKGVL
jgi:imidazoleglycerol-phosphate dehydratase/histidinol-phosphatase